MDRDGLGVIIGFREILQHLGPVVHVNLGGFLDIVLGHHQFLVQTASAALSSVMSLSLGCSWFIPLRELLYKLFSDRCSQSNGRWGWWGRGGQ